VISDKYGLKEIMGVRLIHHHTTVHEDEIMVEEYGEFEGKEALIATPNKVDLLKDEKVVPSSWILAGGGYSIFECSSDSGVVTIFKQLNASGKEFFQELADILRKYNFQNLFAPAIIYRDWCSRYPGTTRFLETSYSHPFMSVVTPEQDTVEIKENIIKTAWEFADKPITHGCTYASYCIYTTRGHMKTGNHR
jgi:hypothetical protein